LNIEMSGTTAEVTKIMASNPRRISKIEVVFNLPFKADAKHKKILENTARTCPVLFSLHPDIVKDISFNWDNA